MVVVKAVPLMVTKKPELPAVAELGDRLVMTGDAGLMVKGSVAEIPPVVLVITPTVPAVATM